MGTEVTWPDHEEEVMNTMYGDLIYNMQRCDDLDIASFVSRIDGLVNRQQISRTHAFMAITGFAIAKLVNGHAPVTH